MANNKIQIKRSTANAVVTGLSNGELAFTQASNTLFIGLPDGSGVLRVGGAQYPGTLTANHALVANSTSGIDKVIVANLVANSIWANGAAGTAGDVLTSNGTATYWKAPSAGVAGSTTQVQFNDTGTLAGSAGFTFDKTSNNINVSNTVNAAVLSIGSNFIANTTRVTVGSGVGFSANGSLGTANQVLRSNGSSIYWADDVGDISGVTAGNGLTGGGTSGDITVSVLANNGIVSNSTGTFVAANTGLVANATGVHVNATYIGTISANNATYLNGQLASFYTNASNINTGTLPYAQIPANIVNTTAAFTLSGVITHSANVVMGSSGLSSNGSFGTAGQVLHSNGTATYWAADDQGVTSVATGNGMTGGTITATGTVSVLANNGIVANATGVFVNSNSGLITNSSGVFVLANNGIIANTTGTWVDPANGVYVDASGVGVLANNGIVSNTSGTWAKAANGISVDASGINVVGNTGVTVNTSGVFIGQAVGTTSSVTFANVVTTDLTVNGNTKLGDATSDVVSFTARVNTAIVPSSNQAYDLGSNTLRWANVYANVLLVTGTATFGGNVSIDGNLTVAGNVTTTNVNSVVVSDPMIYLAGNNYSSDLLDIGFAGNYNDGVTNRHTGLFRDHTDGFYKLFYNLTQELSGNNDVDTADASYRTATLVAYLSSGALSTNTTVANLTANSTYSVGIVANTLSLTTALAGTSGGTGKTTVTNNALLVGNSTNGYNELTLGTSGYVLQSNGTALVYDVLDGGSF